MKIYLTAWFFAIILFCAITVKGQTPGKAVVPAADVLKNINSLLDYNGGHLQFEADFLAYDVQGRPITKDDFMKQIATGDYLPLQLYAKPGVWAYRLYKLPANTNEDVRIMVKQIGVTDYGLYKTVGKPIPAFHYVDLNGNTYTPANTKGKIVVLKAWSTSCVPCVNEMPELNKLVDKYKSRKDIIFVSMAYDSKKALEAFTKRVAFKYAVVPVSIAYIQNTLHATGYPAHWVINKQGIVVSMSYDKDEMMAALDREAERK